ncbi:hypothetical protein, partial [Rheinheimera texasensis]|uniref:hypothetical protein n=1 Tax=Rheinheimera texasensis TaxID=306205 RepID=UPI0032B22B07
ASNRHLSSGFRAEPGSVFLWLLSFAETKESDSPLGDFFARRSHRQENNYYHEKTKNKPTAARRAKNQRSANKTPWNTPLIPAPVEHPTDTDDNPQSAWYCQYNHLITITFPGLQ